VVAPVVPHVSYSNPYWWDQVGVGIYYGGPYAYPYPYPYPYPYHYHGDPDGSLKIEVKPRQAEVYVDGYYAGIVDNFDGTFQRLHAAPGEHEISLFLDGYRAVHQKIYLQPNVTFKLKYQMEKLGAGEQAEARPVPPNPPPQQDPYQPPPGPQRGGRPPQEPPPYEPPPPRYPQGPRDPRAPQPPVNVYGTLSIRVQPLGADVLIDGEKWNAPDGQERLVVDLPEGRHTVEIRKDGYRTYVTELDVHRGQTEPLNVSLRAQEER